MVKKKTNLPRENEPSTLSTLKQGIRQLKSQSTSQSRPISKTALSKHTGISLRTINKYPDILAILQRVKTSQRKPASRKNFNTLEEAVAYIEQLTALYKETKVKYNVELKENLILKQQVIKIKEELLMLKRKIGK
ncbi:MAG: hypothetical protein ACYCX4_00320 [Bacillota bacterium]